MRKFRFSRRESKVKTPDGTALVLGEPVPDGDAALGDLRDCSLTSLKHALREYRTRIHPPPTLSEHRKSGPYTTNALYVVADDYAGCSLKYEAAGNLIDARGGDRLLVSVDPRYRTDDADLLSEIAEQAAKPRRARFVRAEADGRWIGPDLDFEFESLRGVSVGDALDFTQKVQLLLEAASGEGDDAGHLEMLLHSGFAQLLVGRRESLRVEAKRVPHDLSNDSGSVELAKDVAALANSGGGIVLFGLATHNRGGGDAISAVLPFPEADFSAERVRGRLRRWVFPSVRDLTIKKSAAGPGVALASIRVPPQDPNDLPFIVRGAVADGRLMGAYVTVVQRREDEAEHLSAETLHACIRFGAVGMGLDVVPRGER